MKRFFTNIKKFMPYMRYSTVSRLRSEVAGSYLSGLWWILDPLLFMMVYSFIVQVVFKRGMENFNIFVLIGLNLWKFFNVCIVQSVSAVRASKGLLMKIYIPKYVLLLINMATNAIKMMISFAIVIVMCIFSKINFFPYIIYTIPIFCTLFIVTFGISLIILHFGVYVKDFANILTVILRFMYYLSGVFFDLYSNVPHPYNELLIKFNPIAYCMHSCRQAIMYQTGPSAAILLFWTAVGLVLTFIGIRTIHKYEHNYIKVI